MAIRFLGRQPQERRALTEILLIAAGAVALYSVSAHYQIANRFFRWVGDIMRVADLLLVLSFLTVALAVFSVRRSLELRRGILLANTDSLTGLCNKRRFMEILQREINRSTRTRSPLSVIMFDLDTFKRVNDHLGHSVGDDILRHLARGMESLLREQDTLARWGGDEFMVIVPDTSREGAVILAERLRSHLEDLDGGEAGTLTASFGVVETSGPEEARELLDRVDQLLYRAKERGRNRVEAERKDLPVQQPLPTALPFSSRQSPPLSSEPK